MTKAEAPQPVLNGAAMAAVLSAGIGAFAVGLVVLINEAGIVAVPSLYAPAGGVSGRTTVAAALWLAAWVVLHYRWRGREIDATRTDVWTLILTGLGVLATFPPIWKLL
jgi:hypothetical protein